MLMRLAGELRRDPAGLKSFEPEAAQDVLANLKKDQPAIYAQIETYIERYGDRVMGELKLETITLRENPAFVIQVLRNYLDRPDLDPDALTLREQSNRREAEKTLGGALGFFSRRKMKKILWAARSAVKYRENMRLARTRMFGLYRDVYRALGDRLTEAGKLDHARDVFYLTVDELLAYHEGRAVSADLSVLAQARKAEFALYETQALPHRFETIGPVYHGNRYQGPARDREFTPGRTLQGLGCYPGVVESEARIIHSPQDELSVNGKILVAERTDPGWAPLFPTTSGILVERGSTLSHSAVVARELGIPAVVGIPGLLQVIEEGERLRMDGGKGEVERLDAVVPGADP